MTLAMGVCSKWVKCKAMCREFRSISPPSLQSCKFYSDVAVGLAVAVAVGVTGVAAAAAAAPAASGAYRFLASSMACMYLTVSGLGVQNLANGESAVIRDLNSTGGRVGLSAM